MPLRPDGGTPTSNPAFTVPAFRLLPGKHPAQTQPAAFADPRSRAQLAQACSLFARMYRPHGAREDTVLYPELHGLLSAAEFDALGEQFEQEEQRRFGEEGFERAVATVARLEKMLGLYDLDRFTP